MGVLVTLELSDDSPLLKLPWIITFGPMRDEEEWEPVVCGPYERPHALALAENIVADEDLMAVVEPLLPALSAEQVRAEILASRTAAEDEAAQADDAALYGDYEDVPEIDYENAAERESREAAEQRPTEEERHAEPLTAPTEAELRAGLHRIAAMLTGVGEPDRPRS